MAARSKGEVNERDRACTVIKTTSFTARLLHLQVLTDASDFSPHTVASTSGRGRPPFYIPWDATLEVENTKKETLPLSVNLISGIRRRTPQGLTNRVRGLIKINDRRSQAAVKKRHATHDPAVVWKSATVMGCLEWYMFGETQQVQPGQRVVIAPYGKRMLSATFLVRHRGIG